MFNTRAPRTSVSMFWGAPPILARFAWDSPSFAARERDTPLPGVMARAIGRAGRKHPTRSRVVLTPHRRGAAFHRSSAICAGMWNAKRSHGSS
jgi:hypothetical protein